MNQKIWDRLLPNAKNEENTRGWIVNETKWVVIERTIEVDPEPE
jgi:hypothetical protein